MRKTNEVRAIDANHALRLLTDLLDKETGAYSKGRNYGLNVARGILRNPDASPTLTLNTLRDAIYEDAVAHGLWDENDEQSPVAAAELISDESDELLYAAEEFEDSYLDDGCHFRDELADVIIMSLSVAGKLGIDIDAAVRRKMEINKERPWKHGKEQE